MVATYSLFNSVINRLITNNVLFLNSVSPGSTFVYGTLERLVFKWHSSCIFLGSFCTMPFLLKEHTGRFIYFHFMFMGV